jgi:hypothetical protein
MKLAAVGCHGQGVRRRAQSQGFGVRECAIPSSASRQGSPSAHRFSNMSFMTCAPKGDLTLRPPTLAVAMLPLLGADGDKRSSRDRSVLAVGLVCSGVLHGLLLVALVLTQATVATSQVIPVDVVLVDEETAGPLQAEAPIGPPQKAAPALHSEDLPPLSIPAPDKPADPLEQKLERLAKLEDTDEHRPLPKSAVRALTASPTSSNVEAAETTYAVSDFIRAQVERRWGLDVSALGGRALSVLIRVEMTNTGTVMKAEIVRNAQYASDKAYQDAALSARNAVILSSPFTLPAGHYNARMAFTLRLNTQDALR